MRTREIVCEAIAKKRLIRFTYKDLVRVVEPHLLGLNKADHLELCAFLVRGFTKSDQRPFWRTYLIEEMTMLTILDETFPGPRKGYNPNDKRMQRIYCRLSRE